MNTSKAILAMAALVFSTTAAAQTGVTIYGVIDTAVEHLSNASASGGNLTRMPSLAGGMYPSRIGLRGTEDLGGGLAAIFTLENGFQPDTGALNQGGRLFGRQAWVGLAGTWGAVTAGRTYSMLFLSSADTDIIGPAMYGLGALDQYLPNARHDNSLSYKGTFDGITLGSTYSFGRDTSAVGGPAATNCAGEVAGNSQACRQYSVMVKYDVPKVWGVVAAYERMNGNTGAANGLSSSNLTDSRLHVGAYANVADWRFGGGVYRRNNQGSTTQPRSDLMYVGASYRFTPQFALDGQIARLDVKNSANDATQFLLRGVYDLSKRSSLYLMVGRINNNGASAISLSAGGTVATGGSQNGLITGIKHSF